MRCPTISVLIPTYRYARFLPEAIESVLAQDFEDIEILISDDASGDGSEDVIRHYASRDARIRTAIQPANLGMVNNWNWCLERVQGKFVKFLFGDDLLISNSALSRLHQALEANPKSCMAASPRRLIDDKGGTIGLWNELKQEGAHPGRALARSCLLQMNNRIGEPSAVMFRRELLPGLFDSRFRQIVDLDLWLSLLRMGDLNFCNEPLCGFRIHPAQATAENRRLRLGFSEHALLLKKHLPHFMDASITLSEDEQRDLFVAMHYTRKALGKLKDAEAVECLLSPFLSQGQRTRYAIEYRLKRPFVNLQRSLSKRIRNRSAEWRFSSGWRQPEPNS